MAAAVLLLLPASAFAQQVTVNSLTDAVAGDCTPDPGGCTLREAMASTSPGTIVSLPAGTYDLTEGPLPAGDNRFLVGAGARTTTITASDRTRVMTVDGSVSVSGVTISDGNIPGGQGGGIYVGPGTELNLIDSAVLSSDAQTGGGIYSEGNLRIERSTIAGNFAEGQTPLGGGLAVIAGDAKLFDTTISENFSNATGAGLYTTANVELHNVTIARNVSDNAPPSGGGIQQAFDDPNDLTVAFNTLVVENEGGNCLGTTNDQIQARFSMADDMLCNVPQAPEFGNTPIPPFTANIGDLADNGGPTDTHQLFAGSPAVDEAEPGSCEGQFDQRGLRRPAGCDIGAYERAGVLAVTRESDRAGLCTDDDCSLREAIDLVATEGAVVVPAGNYVLSLGELSVRNEVVVSGVGARATTFTAGTNSRVLSVSDGGFLTLFGVRITGGNLLAGQNPFGSVGGGIAVIDAGVSLIDSAVDNNSAGRGGGIYSASGGVLLTDTTVSANQAVDTEIGAGGGLYLEDSSSAVVNSTISGNTARTVGGGIMTIGSMLDLSSVTLAANGITFGQGTGSAIFRAVLEEDGQERGETHARNVLIAGHSGTDCAGDGPFEVANVITDHASCPGQLVGDALIGDLASNDAETDTHALLAGSPAIDAGANCPPADQRGVARPQGAACDVGAYERAGSSPPPPSPPPPPPSQPPLGSQQELPPPEAGEEVNASPKSGTVRVKVRGSNRFVELEEGRQIPVGSVIDTTKGRVTIEAAGGQRADFYDGVFRLGQGKGARPLTTLTLVEALSCPRGGRASAAAKKKKRRLWGDGNGKFRTKGKHSAATVVGTTWLVEDRCDSTLTRVTRGRVSVRDFVKKKTVIVRAGKKYVARAKR